MHRIWQVHNVMPHEVYALERSQKVFLYASEEIAIEAEIEAEKERLRKTQKGGKR